MGGGVGGLGSGERWRGVGEWVEGAGKLAWKEDGSYGIENA